MINLTYVQSIDINWTNDSDFSENEIYKIHMEVTHLNTG